MYQSSRGGRTYVPMEIDGRIISRATPRLAKMVSGKYAEGSSQQVVKDFKDSHCVDLNRSYVQDLSRCVSEIMIEKEGKWHYKIEKQKLSKTAIVSISRDGTTSLIKGEGYKETMCGSISLYDRKGDRLQSIYLASSPEKGKESFNYLLDQEIAYIKSRCPDATYIGLADGAKDNWTYLQRHVEEQVLDYYHAAEYLSSYSQGAFRQKQKQKGWFEQNRKILKEQPDGALQVLASMKANVPRTKNKIKLKKINSSITYFENHYPKMNYWQYQQHNYPIGSGVIEAACKVIVKQRLGGAGMRWTTQAVDEILIARALKYTDGRWEQFWKKVDQYGIY